MAKAASGASDATSTTAINLALAAVAAAFGAFLTLGTGNALAFSCTVVNGNDVLLTMVNETVNGKKIRMGDRLRTFSTGETPHESNFSKDGTRIFHASIGKVYTPGDDAHSGPVKLTPAQDAIKGDLERLRQAIGDAPTESAFMGSISPGQIAFNYPNQHYDSHETYLEALATCRRLARGEGLDAAFAEHRLDAIVAPSNQPAWLIDHANGDHYVGGASTPAAIAGYPNLTVPMGIVFELPIGISFMGKPWTDGTLIRLASAFEHATRLRRRPRASRG